MCVQMVQKSRQKWFVTLTFAYFYSGIQSIEPILNISTSSLATCNTSFWLEYAETPLTVGVAIVWEYPILFHSHCREKYIKTFFKGKQRKSLP